MITIMLALALDTSCVATTTVPEFQARIHEACEYPDAAKYVRYFKVEGDHEKLIVTMAWRINLSGVQIANTPKAFEARDMARQVYIELKEFYPMKIFRYKMLEANDIEFCTFEFEEDKVALAVCLIQVP